MTEKKRFKGGRKPLMTPEARLVTVHMEPTMIEDLDKMAEELTSKSRNALIRLALASAIDDWKRKQAAAVVAP